MVEAGGGLGLAAEPLHEGLVLDEALEQHLERYAAAKSGVLGQVDVGHAAAAQLAEHAIAVIDQLSGFESVAQLMRPLVRLL